MLILNLMLFVKLLRDKKGFAHLKDLYNKKAK